MISWTHYDIPLLHRRIRNVGSGDVTFASKTGGGDTFEGYAVQDPIAADLDKGNNWDGAWVVGASELGIQGYDLLDSYTDNANANALDEGVNWDGGWVSSSVTTSNPVTAPALGADTFEGYADSDGGSVVYRYTGQLNYTGWTYWDVIQGQVDLVGNGFYDVAPGHGQYMNLGGAGASLAIIKSKNFLLPGGYDYPTVPVYASKSYFVTWEGSLNNHNLVGVGRYAVVLLPAFVDDRYMSLDFGHSVVWGEFTVRSWATGVLATGDYVIWVALRLTPDIYCGPLLDIIRVYSLVPGSTTPLEEGRVLIGNENSQPVQLPPNDPLASQSGYGWSGGWITGTSEV